MRDEVLRAELADGDLRGPSQGAPRVHDQREIVAVDDDGLHLRVVGLEGENANFDGVEQDFVGNAAGERALNGDFDVRVLAAVLVEKRQQVKAGVLVCGEVEAASVQGAQFGQSAGSFVAQVEKLERVIAQDVAGVGQRPVAGGALEEHFAEFGFELGDGLRDSRLGSVQPGGRAGEAALFGDGQEGFELEEVHGAVP